MISASALWNARAKAGIGPGGLVIRFVIAGYGRVFTTTRSTIPTDLAWISEGNAGQLTMSVNDLEGSHTCSDLSITVLDYQGQLTQDFQNGINLLGRQVTIQAGFPGMPASQFITLMTMIVDHIDLANQNTAYKFTMRDNSLLLNQFAYTVADDGYPTGNNHRATVQGTPMSILESAVLQSGLPAANVNTAAIALLNTYVYFGLNFRFTVSYPPSAKGFMEGEILKPLGAYWFWNNLGQLTPFSMLPWQAPTSVFTLDRTNIAFDTPPTPTRSTDYTSVVTYRMDGDPNGQNYQTILVGAYAPAINLYGVSQMRSIQSRGVRSNLGGARIAHLCWQNIFRRYGLKPLTLKIRCFTPAMLVEISDKVTLNHELIPNGMFLPQFRMLGPQGTRIPLGIQNTLWEVKGKTIDLNRGTTELTLLDVGWQVANPVYEFAPGGEGLYPANKSSSYLFYSSPAGVYSDGSAARLIY